MSKVTCTQGQLELTRPPTRLPWCRIMAEQSGPSVVITANMHGDELTGLLCAQELMTELKRRLSRGSVTLIPTLNPKGLVSRHRGVSAPGDDLNRHFPPPRKPRTSTEELAGVIWQALLSLDPDLLIDLHSDSVLSQPYVLMDRALAEGGGALQSRLLELAESSRLLKVLDYPSPLYEKYKLDRSLTGAVVNRLQRPALTLEIGPRSWISRSAMELSRGAVLRILRRLGLIDEAPEREPPSEAVWCRMSGPSTAAAGILLPRCEPGQSLERGDLIAELRSMEGQTLERFRAPEDCRVLSLPQRGWLEVGVSTCTLITEESPCSP